MDNRKLKDLVELKKIVEELKKNGKTTVFCNGCFDILHVGHIRYLKEASSFGDVLILALNSDTSVRELKGEGRPVTNQSERAEILAEFPFIDFLIFFDDQNVNRLLLELKPDFHAKGTDYTEETVPEKDTVLSYGGKIIITGDPKDHSCADIISKINADN
ncbi:adenylyltransferase/cytidyltransferase family protein [candidate division KSB1 bacterium]